MYELLSLCYQYHIEAIRVKTSLFSLFIIKLSQDSEIFSFNIFFALKLSENVTSQIQNKHTITATKEPLFSQPLPQPPLSKWRRFLIRDTLWARRWFDSDETVFIVIYLHTPVPNPVMEKDRVTVTKAKEGTSRHGPWSSLSLTTIPNKGGSIIYPPPLYSQQCLGVKEVLASKLISYISFRYWRGTFVSHCGIRQWAFSKPALFSHLLF